MLLCPSSPIQDKVLPSCSALIRLNSILLLRFFYHGSLIAAFRGNFLVNNAIEKILLLTRRAERYLVVCAVRFVRTVLSRNVSFNIRALFFLMKFMEIINWLKKKRILLGISFFVNSAASQAAYYFELDIL